MGRMVDSLWHDLFSSDHFQFTALDAVGFGTITRKGNQMTTQTQIDQTLDQIAVSRDYLTALCDRNFKLPFMGDINNCLWFLINAFTVTKFDQTTTEALSYPELAAHLLAAHAAYTAMFDTFKADASKRLMVQDMWPEALTPGYVSSVIVAASVVDGGKE